MLQQRRRAQLHLDGPLSITRSLIFTSTSACPSLMSLSHPRSPAPSVASARELLLFFLLLLPLSLLLFVSPCFISLPSLSYSTFPSRTEQGRGTVGSHDRNGALRLEKLWCQRRRDRRMLIHGDLI